MKLFVSACLLMSGLLVSGGANAAIVATATYRCGFFSTITPTSVTGVVGDIFTVQNLDTGACSSNIGNTAVVTGPSLSFGNSTNTYTLVGTGITTVDFIQNTITVTVTAPAPTVTSISPTFGSTAGGDTITITGTNFTGATGIRVGGVACSAFNVASATSATCKTPAGAAGRASVVVTTGGGSNAANTLFTYIAVAAIPSLSEWTQLLLALMVMTVIGWHFHRERSY